MARPKKPLAAQKGDLRVAYKNERKNIEAGVAQNDVELLKKPPKWLIDKNAKQMWGIITNYLLEHDFYGNIDVGNVGGYCNAYARYVACWERFKADNDADIADEVKKWSDEMTKCQNRGGFSVNARLSIGEKKAKEEHEGMLERFGLV